MKQLDQAKRSLDGLSTADAFGQTFFGQEEEVLQRIRAREIASAPWPITDDSIMAIALVECLEEKGEIDQDLLAAKFAANYAANPRGGYGGTAHRMLRSLVQGQHWRDVSPQLFDGFGSYGNGAAMRVAPLGAYFADRPKHIAEQARLSAEITHTHPEGIAGAQAIALATAWMTQNSDNPDSTDFFAYVLEHTPDSLTRAAIHQASHLPTSYSSTMAAKVLGNGIDMSSQDTVPFCLWCVASHLTDYENAIWKTVEGLGDRDTTCAIVGGILASSDAITIPQVWLENREALSDWETSNECWGF